ncbi:MAG: sigma-70 family RNA polymerase sigma factor [Phycisphaerae bacterium]|nr:sigma-70 family RNA polymerase sigma factor [Phycisphaerae bacterium]
MGTMATASRPKGRRQFGGFKASSACRKQVGEEGLKLLRDLLAHKHDFIDHPRFSEAGIEAELFGEHFDEEAAARQVFGEAASVPARFVKMTAEEEGFAFLRYNYARRSLVALLAARRESDAISPALAAELIRHHKRVLAVRSDIVNANFPLVLAMAKHSRFAVIDMNEMISEGNMALLRSINKFDLSKGFRFSSYACRSILKAYSRVAHRISRYRQHFPTEYEESMERSDFLDRRREEHQDHIVEELQAVLSKNAAHLNDVEHMVIVERFALGRDGQQAPDPKTLGEVGEMVGLTKERVRQIQNRALEKLRIAMANRFAAA